MAALVATPFMIPMDDGCQLDDSGIGARQALRAMITRIKVKLGLAVPAPPIMMLGEMVAPPRPPPPTPTSAP